MSSTFKNFHANNSDWGKLQKQTKRNPKPQTHVWPFATGQWPSTSPFYYTLLTCWTIMCFLNKILSMLNKVVSTATIRTFVLRKNIIFSVRILRQRFTSRQTHIDLFIKVEIKLNLNRDCRQLQESFIAAPYKCQQARLIVEIKILLRNFSF